MTSPSLASILTDAVDRAADDIAIVFEDTEVTFGQLGAGADRAAAALDRLGVGRGDRVALWMGNHPSFAAVMYGVWRIGAAVVPIHAMLTEPEARHIVDDSGAKVAVCGEEQFSKLADFEARYTHDELREIGAGRDAPALADVDPADLALLGYTSGTSGVPKGAMLSHANLRSNLEQMQGTPIAQRTGDVNLCVLPLFHIYGLNVVLNLSIYAGTQVVLHERFDARAALDAIHDRHVTLVAAAPPAYVEWLRLDDAPVDAFASVRAAVSGAAPLPGEVLKGFRERFGIDIWEGYGLTETSPALTTTAMGGRAKAGSIGKPLPGVEIRLVDEDGQPAEEGDPGEIVVRGPNVFSGYWNRPEETAHALRDGWFRTGDVAITDGDGDLYLVDRRRDMILVSGFNVYPHEVENVLRAHPDIADCAVVGMADDRSGEAVHAFVVPTAGRTLDEADVVAFCAQSLAPYKLPSRVDVVSELPRNTAGKVLRRVLRD
jgi:long-chain acyl-CoA synthetase